MNISIIKQDLFKVEQGYYLAHCISADFALGAGVAKTFVEVYNMREKLKTLHCDYKFDGEGTAILVDNVFNLITKDKYWHKPTYDSITDALISMKDQIEELHITKLAMPKIGCGLDRLDWDEIYKIIEDIFYDTDIDILICTID